MRTTTEPARIMPLFKQGYVSALRCMACVLGCYIGLNFIVEGLKFANILSLNLFNDDESLSVMEAFLLFVPFFVALKYMHSKYEKSNHGILQSFYFSWKVWLFLFAFTWLFVWAWNLLISVMLLFVGLLALNAFIL